MRNAPPLTNDSAAFILNQFILLCCRVRPIGSTSEADTEFDRMKQVGIMSFITTRILRLGRFYTPCVVELTSRSCFAGNFG